MREILRQTYAIVSLFALLQIVVLASLCAVAFGTGRIDRTTIKDIIAILRGEESVDKLGTETGAALASGAQDSGTTSEARIKELIEAQDIARLKSERAMADLQQLESLVNQRMLSLRLDIEKHEQKLARVEAQRQKKREQEISAGYRSTIQTIEGMKPKTARDLLRTMSDSDAVKILLALDEAARTRILEAAKNAQETGWRDRMMQEMLKQPLLTSGRGS